MSLLKSMAYREYQKALEFSLRQCEVIAKLAQMNYNIDLITFKTYVPGAPKPGETLVKGLDRYGLSLKQYNDLVTKSYSIKTITTFYKPRSKVAILVANEKYINLSKLATPSVDCDSLASRFKNMGFITITIKNSATTTLKNILSKIFDLLEEDSYCLFFYAGHGCQLCNTKCMLGIECPEENISLDHCITENFVVNEMARFKPDLGIIIMDMCRVYLNRMTNSDIYATVATVEDINYFSNLLISYSTQSAQAAYEVLQIECSTTINMDETYQLKTGDTDRIVPEASQYVKALCSRLDDDMDVSSLLDKVHEDVASSPKKQTPIKVQCGCQKRSLYDPAKGDTETLENKLQEAIKDYQEYCDIL